MSDAQQQKMAQMAEMMQDMAGTAKPDTSRISETVAGETRTWGDGRMTGRFRQSQGNAFDPPRGQDPLKKLFHKSRAKPTPLDMDDIQTALLQPGIADANFYPLHETMSHPYWSDTEKVGVLKKCLLFGPDVNQRNASMETPLQHALLIKTPELARIAAMSLIEHGADLNVLDKDGQKSLHYAMAAGHPELIPAMLARGATPGRTARGVSLSQIALDRFGESMAKNIANDPQQFEKDLGAYYKSMAYVKAYKLHDREFALSDHREKLLDICKKQPGHRKFIDDVEKKVNDVQSVEQISKAQPSRPYTNPGRGFNYEIEGSGAHAWLGGFTSFMDKIAGKLSQDAYLVRSKNRMSELMNKPELINNPKVLAHLRAERKDIDIDYVLMDAKTNPRGDTLLTRLGRTGNIEGISDLIDMHANLNAQDAEGNTAMHLLVENCKNKEELLIGLKQLVGVRNAEGKLATLGGGTNYADRDIVNGQGKTFMDALQNKHPEWLAEFCVELGARPMQPNLSELEISKVLMLEGPEGMLRVGKNPDPYLLMDETIPKLEPLSSVANDEERSAHVKSVADALIKIQVLKTTASPEKMKELNAGAEKILNDQSPDTKMQACLLFAQDPDLDSYKLNAQAMLLHGLGHTMRNGTKEEKSLVYDTFEKTDVELQFRITALMQAQSMIMAGEASKLGPDDQGKFNTAVSNLNSAATIFEGYMAAQAKEKYQITTFEVDKQKSDPT